MTVSGDEWQAYHVGIAVRDLDPVAERYSRLFGVQRWHTLIVPLPGMPFDPDTSNARVKVALGRGAGLTFELIQVLEGRTTHSQFIDAHGEGVHHLGFWVPDVQAAVAAAVAEGATLTTALLSADGTAAVQLSPMPGPNDFISAIQPQALAYMNPGLGGVHIELVGIASHAGLRRALGPDFANVIISPPWVVG